MKMPLTLLAILVSLSGAMHTPMRFAILAGAVFLFLVRTYLLLVAILDWQRDRQKKSA